MHDNDHFMPFRYWGMQEWNLHSFLEVYTITDTEQKFSIQNLFLVLGNILNAEYMVLPKHKQVADDMVTYVIIHEYKVAMATCFEASGNKE